MQTTEAPARSERPIPRRTTPRWVWWVLLLGAVGLLVWAWFLASFLPEPSAVGRSRLVLVTWSAYSAVAAVAGVAASVGLVRQERWGRTLAALAATAMTLTVVGAFAGLPVLIWTFASRVSPRT